MTTTETIYMVGALFTVGISAGVFINDFGHIDRCEKYGETFMLSKAVICSVKPSLKETNELLKTP